MDLGRIVNCAQCPVPDHTRGQPALHAVMVVLVEQVTYADLRTDEQGAADDHAWPSVFNEWAGHRVCFPPTVLIQEVLTRGAVRYQCATFRDDQAHIDRVEELMCLRRRDLTALRRVLPFRTVGYAHQPGDTDDQHVTCSP